MRAITAARSSSLRILVVDDDPPPGLSRMLSGIAYGYLSKPVRRYPRGLSGDSIPLEGRIAAVADVFDALTSDRIYRPAWSVESAVAWMSSERGKHFDPEVLDAFASSIDEVRAVHSLLTDG